MERAPDGSRFRIARATSAAVPLPFPFGPNVYLAHTQPGFEEVAAREIAAICAAKIAGPTRSLTTELPHTGKARRAVAARELARRTVPDRAGMTIFLAARPEPLRLLRTVEDVFAVVGYRNGLTGDATALERIAATARDAPYLDAALAARGRLIPGSRSGRRLRYRVVARMGGEHEFRRTDLQRAVERGIGQRADHTWRLSNEEGEIEFWATLLGGELILAVRLSDHSMRQRDYKIAHLPGSLRPSVAAALGWLSQPSPDDIVLDPLCGTGTVLIERAHLGRYQLLIGCDRDAVAIAAARENAGPRFKPLEFHPWDAAAIPLPNASVSKIITNLPWGIRHGSHEENRRLYPKMFAEFQRVIRPSGPIVILSSERRLMSGLITRGLFHSEKMLEVSVLGRRAAVYVGHAAI